MTKKQDNQEKYLVERRRSFAICEAAKNAGIGRSTVQAWRKQDKKFRQLDDAVGRGAPSERPDFEPVSIEEFVRSSRYLNKSKMVRPVVLEALKAIQAGEFHTILAVGAIGTGKSYLLQILFCYYLYVLSCIENPHALFGLDPDTPLILVIQNRTEKLSQQNDYSTIKAMLLGSEYFQKAYPPTKKPTQDRMHFPGRIEIWAESGDPRSILGMNPICCLLDEVNYMDRSENSVRSIDGNFDQAREMYSVARTRQHSRFYLHGELHSKILIASSANFIGEFTEAVEKEAETDPGIFVWKLPIWEARPVHYSDETFAVFVGDQARDPFIVKDTDEIASKDRHLIIHPPSDFRKHAGRDLYKFLQDSAGLPVRSSAVFFPDRESLVKAFKRDSILSRDSIISGEPIMVVRDRLDPTTTGKHRFVHLDLSKTKNATGFACGFISHFIDVDRGLVKEELPVINIEAALAIRPPRHGEIDYAFIRALIYAMRQDINIVAVRADQFQSTDMLQELARHGFGVSHLSVDRTTDPYLCFKDAVADQRIILPRNPVLHREAMNVIIDYQKGKVDHPINGSKDVLDAVVGVTYALSKDKVQRINAGAGLLMPQLGSIVTPIFTAPQELQRHMKNNDWLLNELREGLK